jgi:hypothetical protein
MDIGSILIGLALALLVAAYIGRPILVKSGRVVTVEDRRLSELQAQRDRILNRVQELDMDFAMGKVLESDYRLERQGLIMQGAEVLKAIDMLVGSSPSLVSSAATEDEIEAAVARLRGKSRASTDGYCPSCGAEVQNEDAFCTSCGTSLQMSQGAN